jgi:RNA polymerase sigma-70 factor (ECF subfamily)
MVKGKEIALKEALKIDLNQSHLYHSLLAELYKDLDNKKQKEHLQIALKLVDTENDRKVILRKLKIL